jgi:hypothetical protein
MMILSILEKGGTDCRRAEQRLAMDDDCLVARAYATIDTVLNN